MNYDTLPSGLPTPAHVWEAQFHAGGRRRGHLPAEKLAARVRLLERHVSDRGTDGGVLKRLKAELAWRACQLSKAEAALKPRP